MFSEISLHILDIAQNSIKAGASLVQITVSQDSSLARLFVCVEDNGCGMTEEQLADCKDPFYTTRTTRSVGLGVPFFRESAQCTGGSFAMESQVGVGTKLTVEYCTDHIDCIPLGDINATIYSLIIMNPSLDFVYIYERENRSFQLDTREMRENLGDVPLDHPQVTEFIREYLQENKQDVDQGII